ncbi:hypothetical protein HPP92_017481 [Vanilla planifolia]|uniref:Uncharacterized protein n=1 Tax=Vanilla planifolia TaxID=51239 RepID=A0A835QG57_VANPL|nr:hypothetical protein HPP92_017481 [Vanilla planifolia]
MTKARRADPRRKDLEVFRSSSSIYLRMIKGNQPVLPRLCSKIATATMDKTWRRRRRASSQHKRYLARPTPASCMPASGAGFCTAALSAEPIPQTLNRQRIEPVFDFFYAQLH